MTEARLKIANAQEFLAYLLADEELDINEDSVSVEGDYLVMTWEEGTSAIDAGIDIAAVLDLLEEYEE